MQFFFADHTLDTDLRELRRDGAPINVEPQVLDLLIYLVQNRERVVSKDDLVASVWGGRIVSDATLTSRIYAARKAIGDSGQEQRLIRTIARKGLRFVGDVEIGSAGGKSTVEAGSPQDELPERWRPSLSLPDRPAIAVLPFSNMSGDPEQDYFSDGMSEDIITGLSKLRWFFVIARNSSFIYKGRAVHVSQVGEELGVGYVVEGSVRKEGERVRVTAQLNDVISGSHLWAERYDRGLADVFAVQDEITDAIVSSIEPQLYAAEGARARRQPPESLDAWDLVMRALSHFWRVTREDNAIAQELATAAIGIDPHYGQALALLAASQTFGAFLGWENIETVLPRAERAALAAVQIDGEDPWAHYALASVYLMRRHFDDALAEYELALRLNPNFLHAQNHYAAALAFCGRWEEAGDVVRHALRSSPRDPFSALYYATASYAQYVAQNYEEAMRLSGAAIRMRRDFASAHRVHVAAAGMVGRADVAGAALRELRRAQPNISLAWVAAAVPLKHDADRDRYIEGFRRAGLE